MTIEEINAILDRNRKITNGYNGCKIKILNTKICGGIEEYEKAVNDFLSQHNIINAIPTQSDYMHSITIFYKE